MMLVVFAINLLAVMTVISRGLPRPFPWAASAGLAIILLISGFISPIGRIERAVSFVTLVSSMIVTARVSQITMPRIRTVFTVTAILLTAFILLDAFRIINTPDVTMTAGETFSLVRRPYLFEHPNVKASWLLLLSLSVGSFVGILVTQSRGALLGYIAACFRFVPKRFYFDALVLGAITLGLAALIRPGTFFGRVDLWRAGLDMFLAHPLIGHGTGSYLVAANNGMATAHNAALTIAAENGLIGLAAFGAWVIGVGALVMRSSHIAKYNLLAFSVQQLVDDQWLHPISAILLGMVLAVCLFQVENDKS